MVSPRTYLQQVMRELKKVTWPDQDQTFQMTILVIGVSVIIGAYIGALDYIFKELMNLVVANI